MVLKQYIAFLDFLYNSEGGSNYETKTMEKKLS